MKNIVVQIRHGNKYDTSTIHYNIHYTLWTGDHVACYMNVNVKMNENVGCAAGSGCYRKWAVSNALILSYCFVDSICYFSYAM